MWKRLQKEIHPFILYNDQDSEGATNLKDVKNFIMKSMPKQDGRPILRSHRETVAEFNTFVLVKSVGATRWLEVEQKLEFLAILILDWTAVIFFVQRLFFACRKVTSMAVDRWVDRFTCHTPHFHMHSHSTVQMTCVHWLKGPESSRRVVLRETFLHPRVMSHFWCTRTLSTSFPSLSSTSPVLMSPSSPKPDLLSTYPIIHCEDARQDGTSTSFHSCTETWRRIETRTAEFNDADSSIDQELWDLESFVSYWRNLISKLYDGNTEVHYFGIAFRQIPRLRWLSMLESPFQDQSVCEYTVPSTHIVVDKWSGDGKINRRSFDVAANWRAQRLPDFEMPDARIASALRKIIFNTSFRRRLRGRKIAYTISDHLQATGAYDAAHGLSDLFNICLQNDDVQDFDTKCDQNMLRTSELPHENVQEGLHKMKLQGSE